MAAEAQAAASRQVRLEASWLRELEEEFSQPYMRDLSAFLRRQKSSGKAVYPPGPDIFKALESTPLPRVRVVILGQDPYHGPGQAHGLCFSVPAGVPAPPSLLNIYRELESDLGCAAPRHGCLEHWAGQGVLLLNSVLTVEAHRAASHRGKGWERFTDRIVEALNEKREGLVFLLWGAYAQRKGEIIDRRKHLVLAAPHPSPLSAERGFFGCRHFSKTNDHLQSRGERPIDWQLPATVIAARSGKPQSPR